MDVAKKTRIVIEILKPLVPKKARKSIGPDSALREDLGLNSIQMITLASELEEKTSFDILAHDDIDFSQVKTVGDVISLID
ncbi:MAG: acyl carrier protein [Cytophagales bacterium]|nr:acyl carrier protein [Cytophagales bacterium]